MNDDGEEGEEEEEDDEMKDEIGDPPKSFRQKDKNDENIIKEEFYSQLTSKVLQEADMQNSGLSPKQFQLSEVSLSIMTDSKDVILAVELTSIFDDSDKLIPYQCCHRIEQIQDKKKFDFEEPIELFCFDVNLKREILRLCHENPETLSDFRNHLRIYVLSSISDNKLGSKLQILEKLHKVDIKTKFIKSHDHGLAWTFQNQDDWKGICAYGQAQSPIKIQPENMKHKDMNIVFKYDESKSPIEVKYVDQQAEISGDFGSIIHVVGTTDQTEYKAKKFIFKSHSEHLIDDRVSDGEIQIYHINEMNGNVAILSFLLVKDDQHTSIERFFTELDTDLWDLESPRTIKKPINLDYLVGAGLEIGFRKSFFWYMGSESKPPCQEGITHFIMEEPVLIKKSQFDQIMKFAYDHKLENGGNSRKQQEVGSRIVYYNYDDFKPCNLHPQRDPPVLQDLRYEIDSMVANENSQKKPSKEEEISNALMNDNNQDEQEEEEELELIENKLNEEYIKQQEQKQQENIERNEKIYQFKVKQQAELNVQDAENTDEEQPIVLGDLSNGVKVEKLLSFTDYNIEPNGQEARFKKVKKANFRQKLSDLFKHHHRR